MQTIHNKVVKDILHTLRTYSIHGVEKRLALNFIKYLYSTQHELEEIWVILEYTAKVLRVYAQWVFLDDIFKDLCVLRARNINFLLTNLKDSQDRYKFRPEGFSFYYSQYYPTNVQDRFRCKIEIYKKEGKEYIWLV